MNKKILLTLMIIIGGLFNSVKAQVPDPSVNAPIKKEETRKERELRLKEEAKRKKNEDKLRKQGKLPPLVTEVESDVPKLTDQEQKEKLAAQKQEVAMLRKKIDQAMQQKRFDSVAELILQIPDGFKTQEDASVLDKIKIFKDVDALEKEENSMFRKSTKVDEVTQGAVKRLYQGAQEAILLKKNDLAKDMLIQSLFLDRGSYKSKKLLEMALNYPVGSYAVEDVEAKYWKSSLTNFYSGYPEKAVEDLKVLEYFAPQNPEVFKRMGSAYYSMGETTQAVQSWKRALYLDEKDEKLKEFIKNATEEIENQEQSIKEQLAYRNKVKDKKEKEGERVTLGIYKTASQAYSFAQEVKEKQKGVTVEVVEQDGGKWAVQIIKEGKK